MKQDSPNTQQLSFLAPNLIDQLNPKHPLLQLAKHIPWSYFDTELWCDKIVLNSDKINLNPVFMPLAETFARQY